MPDQQNLVQVFIPVYNCELYIAEAIESALSQDYPNVQVIIVDNCSTDGTASIVRSFSKQGVLYYKNSTNIGSLGNALKCLGMATGEFVKLLCADDVLLPGIISSQVAMFRKHESVGLVSCNIIVTNDRLAPIGKNFYLSGFLQGGQAIASTVASRANLIGGPSNWLLRTSLLNKLKHYTKSFLWLADLDIACTILSCSDYASTDGFGYYYRRHSQSDSALNYPELNKLKEVCRFTIKWKGEISVLAASVLDIARFLLIFWVKWLFRPCLALISQRHSLTKDS